MIYNEHACILSSAVAGNPLAGPSSMLGPATGVLSLLCIVLLTDAIYIRRNAILTSHRLAQITSE